MSHEEKACMAHRDGSNCAAAVYNAFEDVNPNPGAIPKPRSDGGKCGAVLAAEQLLRDMGIDGDFDQRFTEHYGSLKCADLRRTRALCNDLVGGAAKLVDACIEKAR